MVYKKIKQLRLERGLTQKTVAEALHMSQNAYSELETGKTQLTEQRLRQLVDFYKVSPLEILQGGDMSLNFNDKVENGDYAFAQNVFADNKELIKTMQEQLSVKDALIKTLIGQNEKLVEALAGTK